VSEDFDNAIPVFGSHGILIGVKVTKIFDTDAVLIGSLDAGRNVVYRSADGYQAIRERGHVLSNFGETAIDHMKALHTLEHGKMVANSIEVDIVWLKSVVYLE
jgi:hypothetical protein